MRRVWGLLKRTIISTLQIAGVMAIGIAIYNITPGVTIHLLAGAYLLGVGAIFLVLLVINIISK